MFAGSVRANLDPSSEYDDAACWTALKDVGLDAVRSLDQTVVEAGANFSLGERQLLSLARGLLRLDLLRLDRSPILIVDEASASIDEATDRKIQDVLRHTLKMRGGTLIVVAHRLNTVLDLSVFALRPCSCRAATASSSLGPAG